MSEIVTKQLAEARRSLLDLSMRNRLLNFRPTRRSTVHVVEELPAPIWKLLVEEGKSLEFLPVEEEKGGTREAEDGSSSEPQENVDSAPPDRPLERPRKLPSKEDKRPAPSEEVETRPPAPANGERFHLPAAEPAPLDAKYTDRFLQTDLSGDDLQTNLLHIYRQAISALDERGANLLFLAVGFLSWRQAEGGEQTFRAPILLIPVELERTSAKRRFKLLPLDDDPVLNPCLQAMMREMRVEMPEGPEDWSDFDVDAYFGRFDEVIRHQEQWSIEPEIFLGFFSFTKYLMYVDLDAERWPADADGKPSLLANPLIRGLCGDDAALAGDPPDIPSAERLDEVLDPEDVYQVLDADASQQRAILASKKGASLVIEGPPGTGKSQTISNIIAECLAAGKTVLFVSQKMAALDVVKRRLERVGLGDACLELHSTKANKRALLTELDRVFARADAREERANDDIAKLRRLRARLNDYVSQLHEPFAPLGMTPYAAIGRAMLLKNVPEVGCAIPGCETWDAAKRDKAKDILGRLAGQMRAVGRPDPHPWEGARIREIDTASQRMIREVLGSLRKTLGDTRRVSASLASRLGASAPDTLGKIASQRDAARCIAEAPEIPERLLVSEIWDEPGADILTLVDQLNEYAATRARLEPHYDLGKVAHVDWRGLAQRYDNYARGLFRRLLRPQYWRDRKLVRSTFLEKYRPGFAEMLKDFHDLGRMHELKGGLDASTDTGRAHFGDAWQGSASDAEMISRVADALRRLRGWHREGIVGVEGLSHAATPGRAGLEGPVLDLDKDLGRWRAAWGKLAETVALDERTAFGKELAAVGLDALARRLEAMESNVEALVDWCRYQELLQACEKSPLAEFVKRAQDDDIPAEVLPVAMEKQFLRLWLDHVIARREALHRFNGHEHEADILDFARLDHGAIERNRHRLRELLKSARPAGGFEAARSSQLGILQGEIRRKRGGRPIRRILSDAADVIQKLKPCLMMSPLSVAQFIAPEGMRFDVVIFDEASQVEPADALGAIARAGQLVLVGDRKQLPPTRFFSAMSGETEGPVEDEEGAAGIAAMESILDRGSMVLPSLRLRWHYRSRHESLIAFSNREFYDNDLVAFPSTHTHREELGVAMRLEQADRYDRGRSQTNRPQAERIAEWVFEHARTHCDKTLGVGAFSQAQQQAILDAVERRRREDDSLEAFFDHNRVEPFFVKNLETIQGDERDVILISVGYGRGEPGERLSMNFGPLNQDGGWRRLNVLITRARERCIVFTSVLGEDFDLGATQARGVHSLKGYLEFVRSGELPKIEHRDGDFESPFERAVHNALSERGVALHSQVGCAGYAIDMAVVDPDKPGRYLLGIECDGATYHGTATARDRDRLRQQVLERLGWHIHRIWSTDWFRKPEAEVQRALEAIQRAKTGRLGPGLSACILSTSKEEAPEISGLEEGAAEDIPADATVTVCIPVESYVFFKARRRKGAEEFYIDSSSEIESLLVKVVECEGPIHIDEACRRVASVYDISRVGSRIRERIEAIAASAARSGSMSIRGRFLWPGGMVEPTVRRRDEEGIRDIALICPEEIALAARLLLQAQFGMGLDDLLVQTARAFGFAVTGQKLKSAIGEVVQHEINTGRIIDDAGVLKTN